MTIMNKTVGGQRPIVKNKKYAPATGIQYDFEKVLTAFVETKSVRYEDFAKIWREKKLSLICAGRYSQREAKEFMEECMKLAFKMFLPPYGFQARVGALYLLYGLYFTQPCVPKVKIRVTPPDCVHLKGMQEEFVAQNHLDSNYILHKLLAEGAMYFCAATEEPRNRTHGDETNKGMAEELREDRHRIDELFTDETLEHLNLVHSQYHQLKVRIAGPDASRPDRSLDVLQDKFPSSVVEQLHKHHERWKKKETPRQGKKSRPLPTIQEDGESEIDTDQDYQPSSNVGQRRARLKDMAFRGAKNKQRYKHRTLVTESSSSPEKSPRKKKANLGGRLDDIDEELSTELLAGEPNADLSGSIMHMPQVEEDTQQTGNKVGRKRKAEWNVQVQTGSSKQKKTAEEKDDVEGTLSGSASDASKSPAKRGRGRPPKAAKSVSPRPVGRPRKHGTPQKEQPQNEEQQKEQTCKTAKLRVIPLKIKDTAKKKMKR